MAVVDDAGSMAATQAMARLARDFSDCESRMQQLGGAGAVLCSTLVAPCDVLDVSRRNDDSG